MAMTSQCSTADYHLSLSNSVLIIPLKTFSKLDITLMYWIECLKNNGERSVTLYRGKDQKPPQWKERQKGKNGLSNEVLQWRKEEEKKQRRERKISTQLNEEFQRFERRDKKPFFKKQCKEIGGNNKICSSTGPQENWRRQGNIFYKDEHNKGQEQQGINRLRRD